MYNLTELLSADFTGDGGDEPLNALRWKVAARCTGNERTSAEVFSWVRGLHANDRRQALKALHYLVRLAQAGHPLADMLDKKRLHETHRFHCAASGKEEKVWRYRDGDIRILFYYGRDRLVLLTNLVPKRSDKLSQAELNRAEQAVHEYLMASQDKTIRWLS